MSDKTNLSFALQDGRDLYKYKIVCFKTLRSEGLRTAGFGEIHGLQHIQ